MYCSLRKQPTFCDVTTGFPVKWRGNNIVETSAETPYWLITPQIWVVLLIGQSEALPRSGYWRVISMEFLRSFLRRHFAGRPSVVSRNVGCFLRLQELQLHVISIVCHHGCKLACEQTLHLGEGSEPRERGGASGETAFYACPSLSLILSFASRVCTFYEIL